MLSEKAGYADVSQFLRVCLFDRLEVERFKTQLAEKAVKDLKPFRVGFDYLRAAGLED